GAEVVGRRDRQGRRRVAGSRRRQVQLPQRRRQCRQGNNRLHVICGGNARCATRPGNSAFPGRIANRRKQRMSRTYASVIAYAPPPVGKRRGMMHDAGTRRAAKPSGFALVEILLAMLVLSILVAVVVMAIWNVNDKGASARACRTEARSFAAAVT